MSDRTSTDGKKRQAEPQWGSSEQKRLKQKELSKAELQEEGNKIRNGPEYKELYKVSAIVGIADFLLRGVMDDVKPGFFEPPSSKRDLRENFAEEMKKCFLEAKMAQIPYETLRTHVRAETAWNDFNKHYQVEDNIKDTKIKKSAFFIFSVFELFLKNQSKLLKDYSQLSGRIKDYNRRVETFEKKNPGSNLEQVRSSEKISDEFLASIEDIVLDTQPQGMTDTGKEEAKKIMEELGKTYPAIKEWWDSIPNLDRSALD